MRPLVGDAEATCMFLYMFDLAFLLGGDGWGGYGVKGLCNAMVVDLCVGVKSKYLDLAFVLVSCCQNV